MTNLNQQQWQEQLAKSKNAQIIDVRTLEELEEGGKIPNAIHMDIYLPQAFMEKLSAFDTSKDQFIYCRSGSRSFQACNVFEDQGFTNVYNLEGGFNAWTGDVEKI